MSIHHERECEHEKEREHSTVRYRTGWYSSRPRILASASMLVHPAAVRCDKVLHHAFRDRVHATTSRVNSSGAPWPKSPKPPGNMIRMCMYISICICICMYIYIYIYMVTPQKKPTCLTLTTKLAPLKQAYVCKTHHRAADTRLRETTKTTKTQKPRKQRKPQKKRNQRKQQTTKTTKTTKTTQTKNTSQTT